MGGNYKFFINSHMYLTEMPVGIATEALKYCEMFSSFMPSRTNCYGAPENWYFESKPNNSTASCTRILMISGTPLFFKLNL